MPTLKIKLTGIGICYEKGGFWNVLFPFNQDHEVRFARLPDGEYRSLAGPNRVIEIAAAGRPMAPSGGLNQLIDLTEKPNGANLGLHKDGIEPTEDWTTKGVLLRIKGGIFHQGDTMRSRYVLTKGGVEHTPAKKFGYSAEIILPGDDFTMTLSDTGGSESLVGTAEIVFDNSCPTCPASDDADFEMVYTVVQDAGVNSGDRYRLQRHPDDAPQEGQNSEFFKGLGLGEAVVFATNDPAPGVAGLPCNLVGASDSTKLP